MRWNQFHLLMAGKAPMPEPGFAEALYDQVAGSAESGQQAVAWALGAGADLRQLALVFDWCQDILSEAQSKALAAKLARGIQQTRGDASVSAVRSRLLAAVALSGHLPEVPEKEFEQIVHHWWQGEILPALNSGREGVKRDDMYALMEILHVVRDNFTLDLREGAPAVLHRSAHHTIIELLSRRLIRRAKTTIASRPRRTRKASRTCGAPLYPAPPNSLWWHMTATQPAARSCKAGLRTIIFCCVAPSARRMSFCGPIRTSLG